MLDRPLWPVGQGLTSKRLGNNLKLVEIANGIGEGLQKLVGHLSNVEEIISKDKRYFRCLLEKLLDSNDLSQVLFYDLEKYFDYGIDREIRIQMKSNTTHH